MSFPFMYKDRRYHKMYATIYFYFFYAKKKMYKRCTMPEPCTMEGDQIIQPCHVIELIEEEKKRNRKEKKEGRKKEEKEDGRKGRRKIEKEEKAKEKEDSSSRQQKMYVSSSVRYKRCTKDVQGDASIFRKLTQSICGAYITYITCTSTPTRQHHVNKMCL